MEFDYAETGSVSASLDTDRISRHLPSPNAHAFVKLVCTSCGKSWEHQIDCGDRTCPECNRSRQNRIYARYKPIVARMKKPTFITLTTRRTVLTAGNVRRLRGWFTKLRHRKLWIALCGIYQIELGTIDDLNMCNLHIHAIVDSEYMPQNLLSAAWRDISGNFIVYVERCSSVDGALRYLTQHMGKVIADPRFAELVNGALHDTRLVQGFGDLNTEDLDMGDPVCPFCHAVGSVITAYDELWYDCTERGNDYG